MKGRELKKNWTHGHSGDFILCLMLCTALDRQLKCVSGREKLGQSKIPISDRSCESTQPSAEAQIHTLQPTEYIRL